jgi:hypothetical protein
MFVLLSFLQLFYEIVVLAYRLLHKQVTGPIGPSFTDLF